ncbi:hypothetical protein BJY52DRAFT_1212425 [Lactarius psammicola]|nr:hypothetical protein BJY52DRAFT_1212425 [Lactarius psammicola]
MASIFATVLGPSRFSRGEGPPSLPHQSVEELINWFSSELHSFLSTNNVRAPIVVPTQVGTKGPEPVHADDHQGHPASEGITTLATAIVPFFGHAIPTMVTLTLVPLHLGTDQYPPSLNPSSPPSLEQGSELGPFPSSYTPEPSHREVGHPMTRSDTTIDPRYLEYAPTPGDFQIAPRNLIPQPDVRYDYPPPGPGDPIQEQIPDAAEVAASSGTAVSRYLPPFNQTPGTYLISGHPLSSHAHPLPSSPVNREVIPPSRAIYQNEGNGQSTSRQLGQTYQDTPTFSKIAGHFRGVGGFYTYETSSSTRRLTMQRRVAPTMDTIPADATVCMLELQHLQLTQARRRPSSYKGSRIYETGNGTRRIFGYNASRYTLTSNGHNAC